MIKIRGYRAELGDIEDAVYRHQDARERGGCSSRRFNSAIEFRRRVALSAGKWFISLSKGMHGYFC
jgi:hypothetical protein